MNAASRPVGEPPVVMSWSGFMMPTGMFPGSSYLATSGWLFRGTPLAVRWSGACEVVSCCASSMIRQTGLNRNGQVLRPGPLAPLWQLPSVNIAMTRTVTLIRFLTHNGVRVATLTTGMGALKERSVRMAGARSSDTILQAILPKPRSGSRILSAASDWQPGSRRGFSARVEGFSRTENDATFTTKMASLLKGMTRVESGGIHGLRKAGCELSSRHRETLGLMTTTRLAVG